MGIHRDLSSPSSSSSDDDDNDSHSSLHSESHDEPVMPELSWNDVRVGRILGKGAFSKVKEVTFRNKRLGGKQQRSRKYAIKFLRTSTMSKQVFSDAAVDLAIEAQFLTFLNHENIIKLHAQGCFKEAYNKKNDSRHFLVLDRLDETLEGLLADWIYRIPGFLGEESPSRFLEIPLQVERVQSIALPVAKAMEYLHSNDIVMRDLKPGNVGFQNGTVKLFDFGLARIVRDDRKLTGRVGPPLYMSPEVVLSQHYGLPADVYSFSVMLWELLTLDVPFEGMPRTQLEQSVAQDNIRPALDKSIGSRALQELIAIAWDPSPESRPTFARIREVMESETLMGKKIAIETHYQSASSAEGEARAGGARAA